MSNKHDIKEFFNSIQIEEIKISKGAESLKENDNLFSGDLSSLSDWLLHEKFIIKKKNEDSERALREKNAKKAFNFCMCWMIFIVALILLHGFGRPFEFFKLKTEEFLFVIGSLTASIFTFYTLVLRYLFYRK